MRLRKENATSGIYKNVDAFKPVAESYHAAIQVINDKRQLVELKILNKEKGKHSTIILWQL